MLMMDIHRDAIHSGGVGEVRDDGVGGAFQDEGDENQLSEWSWPSSSLQEMPRPVLRGGCSQEAFQSFTQQWNQYARYHSGMDVGELRQQLLNCADGALETLMYNSLGSKVDTLSQTDLLKQLEQLAAGVVGEDVKQMLVPTVEMLPLTNGQKGGLGGANEKEIPKTFVKCEEPYCQFSVELEDRVSAPRVLRNHMFVAHKRQEQINQQEMTGRKGGRRRIASTQVLDKTSENKNKLITKRQNMTTLGHTYLKSSLPEETVQVKVLNAENSDQVLAEEDSPKYTPVDEVVNVQDSPEYQPVDVEDTVPDDTVQAMTLEEVLAAENSDKVLAAEDPPEFTPAQVIDAENSDKVLAAEDDVLILAAENSDHVLSAEVAPEVKEAAQEEAVKEAWVAQTAHKKVLDKGKPKDAMTGIKNMKENLPMVLLAGMLN